MSCRGACLNISLRHSALHSALLGRLLAATLHTQGNFSRAKGCRVDGCYEVLPLGTPGTKRDLGGLVDQGAYLLARCRTQIINQVAVIGVANQQDTNLLW